MAVVPVIKVITTVFLILALPLAHRPHLMLHQNTLLELCIVVSAPISAVKRDLHGVKFLLRMLLRLEDVVRDCTAEVEESHYLID